MSAWEIWNEENNGWWWGDAASASAYAQVFGATRAALRSVDPQARAVVGGLTFDPAGQSSFVPPQAMIAELAARNPDAFDAVAVHPYTRAAGISPARMAVSALREIALTANAVRQTTGAGPDGGPRQQVWVTEMGWSTQGASPLVVASALQDFLGLLTPPLRGALHLGPVLWYDLRDGGPAGSRDSQIGLRYTSTGGEDLDPKPAWSVFTDTAAQAPALSLPLALPLNVSLSSSAAITLARPTLKGHGHAKRAES